MTKYIGDKVKHLHRNYVVKVSEVTDFTAKRLLRDQRAVNTTEQYLKGIDSRYEILTEFDGKIETLMKEIKYELGGNFKLQTLRLEHKSLYDRLRKLGNPSKLLADYGFNVEIGSNSLSRKTIRSRLWSLVDDKESRRVVGLERRSPSTYATIRRLAKENDMTIKEYVEGELGFKYGKGN